MATANFTSTSGRYFVLFEDNDHENWEVEDMVSDAESEIDGGNEMEFTYVNGDYCRVTCILVARSGYYAGVNIDLKWEIECGNSDKWFEDSIDINDIDFVANSDSVKHVKRVRAKMWSMKEKIEKTVADVLTDGYCVEYVVQGRFSNGEVMYKKVEQ